MMIKTLPVALLSAVSAAALLLSSGCASGRAMSAGMAAPLDREALSRLFLSGYNTYLAPVRAGDVVVDHPPGELFRPNGTYQRILGRNSLEGTYAVEGDLLCVVGDSIAKQCRNVLPQGGRIYLLIDVANNSQALMELSQQK